MEDEFDNDGGNLGDLAARLDAERFVGRSKELACVEESFAGRTPIRIHYVFGPAGVGKSGLLREIGRRGEAAGRAVVRLDGREGPVSGGDLEDRITGAAALDAPLVLIDEADEFLSMRIELRDLFLRVLPASAVVVLAGRRRPEAAWFSEGLEHVSDQHELRPLDPKTSVELLGRYGVDGEDVEPLLRWAQGFPLPLTLAARVADPGASIASTGGDRRWGSPADERVVAELLLDRLSGRELDEIDSAVIEVASIAPSVDSRLLAAVLPGRPTRQAMTQLRELSVSERVGHRVTLHRLVRDSVRDRLRREEPERYRTHVLRIAEHLGARARTEPERAYDVTELIEDPDVRVGSSPSLTHYCDRLHPGDADAVGRALGASDTAWFARFRRWCDEVPDAVLAVRQVNGDLTSLVISGRFTDVPEWALDTIEFGPVVDYAKRTGIYEEGYFVNDVLMVQPDLDEAGMAEVFRVGNAGLLAGFADPYMRYIVATGEVRYGEDGTKPFGYVDIDELDRFDDERRLMSWGVDFGPGGGLGRILEMIRAEQGVAVSADSTEPDQSAALLLALRSFHDVDVLEQSPLGSTVGETRQVVLDRVADAFGDADEDQVLRSLLEHTYLDPEGGHAVARQRAHMSRSSFYRHLQRARDQFAVGS